MKKEMLDFWESAKFNMQKMEGQNESACGREIYKHGRISIILYR